MVLKRIGLRGPRQRAIIIVSIQIGALLIEFRSPLRDQMRPWDAWAVLIDQNLVKDNHILVKLSLSHILLGHSFLGSQVHLL